MIDFSAGSYNGPLDKLLELIQKSEVNIYDIPIAVITDQFLDYIRSVESMGLEDLTDFYHMAADLLYIKSKMLLPIEFDEDEELFQDPRADLVQRLLEYQKFKRYSQILYESENVEEFVIQRKKMQFLLPFADQELWTDFGVQDLLDTYVGLMKGLAKLSPRVFNVFEEVTVDEKTALLLELLEDRDKILFSELCVKKENVDHVVCAFLALLESIHHGFVTYSQSVPYADFYIIKKKQQFNANLASEIDQEADEIIDNDLEDESDYALHEEDADDESSCQGRKADDAEEEDADDDYQEH